MKISKVGGIIAAAKQDIAKPMMEIGAIPIIRRIVISFQQVGIFPIVVMTGADELEVRRLLTGYGIIFLSAQESEGKAPEQMELMDAVRGGLSYLHGKCDKIVFSLVNNPLFMPSTLTTLLSSDAQIVTPCYHGKGGHPLVISDSAVPSILDYRGSGGLQGALRSGGYDRHWVEVDDQGVLTSIHHASELDEQIRKHNRMILHPMLHMQLEKEVPFFSERLKLLLFLIWDTGNMRTACAMSGIAPSKAWSMINQLEENLMQTVVKRSHGGKDGGNTTLTSFGIQFLNAYQHFQEELHRTAQESFQREVLPILGGGSSDCDS